MGVRVDETRKQNRLTEIDQRSAGDGVAWSDECDAAAGDPDGAVLDGWRCDGKDPAGCVHPLSHRRILNGLTLAVSFFAGAIGGTLGASGVPALSRFGSTNGLLLQSPSGSVPRTKNSMN